MPGYREVELPETLFESGLEMQHLQMLRLKFIKMGMPTSEDLGWSLEDYSRITAIPVNRLLNFSFIHQEVMRFLDFSSSGKWAGLGSKYLAVAWGTSALMRL